MQRVGRLVDAVHNRGGVTQVSRLLCQIQHTRPGKHGAVTTHPWPVQPTAPPAHLSMPPQRHLQHIDVVVAHEQRAVRMQEWQRRAPRRQRIRNRIQLAAAELVALEHIVKAVAQALVQPLALLHVYRKQQGVG